MMVFVVKIEGAVELLGKNIAGWRGTLTRRRGLSSQAPWRHSHGISDQEDCYEKGGVQVRITRIDLVPL